jgi:peptidoglycan/xylan/chitin deacetylase (PgdA/CDA1 family)
LLSGPTVLFYHGVAPREVDLNVSNLHHSVEEFSAQMAFLSRYFNVISMTDLEDKLSCNERLSSRDVVVTFDDGFRNNLEYAAPIVDTYSIKPTLFISTGHVDSGMRFPTYLVRCAIWHLGTRSVHLETIKKTYSLESESCKQAALKDILLRLKRSPMNLVKQLETEVRSLLSVARWRDLDLIYQSEEVLDWDGVQSLVKAGWEIGSHCKDHAILNAKNSPMEITCQLMESKKRIASKVGHCDYFSYPNGEEHHISKNARVEVQSSGYSLGFTAQAGDLQGKLDLLLLPRRLAPRSVLHLCYVLQSSRFYRQYHRRWVQSLYPS